MAYESSLKRAKKDPEVEKCKALGATDVDIYEAKENIAAQSRYSFFEELLKEEARLAAKVLEAAKECDERREQEWKAQCHEFTKK